MKASNVIIRIPEPCHEDWNSMSPAENGRFCGSCSKTVIDFTGKTDTEIRTILMENTGKHLCGHFKKTQVNRPLNIRINFKDLPKNISSTRSFAIAVFLVFGAMLFSCTDYKGQTVGEIKVDGYRPAAINTTATVDAARQASTNPVISAGNINCSSTPEDMVDGEFEVVETLKGDTMFEEPQQKKEVIMGKVKPKKEIHKNIKGDVFVEDTLKKPDVISNKVINPELYMLGGLSVSSIIPDSLSSQRPESKSIEENPVQTNFGEDIELRVYPNPGSGEFTVEYEVKNRADVTLAVYDLNGRQLKSIVNLNKQHDGRYVIPVSLSELPNGTYLLNLILGEKRVSKRIVLER